MKKENKRITDIKIYLMMNSFVSITYALLFYCQVFTFFVSSTGFVDTFKEIFETKFHNVIDKY